MVNGILSPRLTIGLNLIEIMQNFGMGSRFLVMG